MTDTVSVDNEQLGELHRKIRAIESRLGKSISHERLMVALQALHDGDVELLDARSRVKALPLGCVVPGLQNNREKQGKSVVQLLEANQSLHLDDSVYDLCQKYLDVEAVDILNDRWSASEVAVADSLREIFEELDMNQWSAYSLQRENIHKLFVYVSECIELQLAGYEHNGRPFRPFLEHAPTYFCLKIGKQLLGVKLWHLSLSPGNFRLAVETDGTQAEVGACIYHRYD